MTIRSTVLGEVANSQTDKETNAGGNDTETTPTQYIVNNSLLKLISAEANNPFTFKTRCSAIAERPRCRVRYSFRQK